jgi:hypothetical protein
MKLPVVQRDYFQGYNYPICFEEDGKPEEGEWKGYRGSLNFRMRELCGVL